ncbi:GspE/PulE family protein [Candidatus Hydrogenosomobacter endosymbioticus]|uniref:Type II secretion system protein E n=1 Tax=Candidatus Hydrogenosomobacter endosymbioticus TaxID=2558174 RepID=A0ABM7V9E8_9PROT|nr:GspE/PulE family protein [Candidatus Hydrogenosomobacter endosymbioticus]BDB96410.1 type II secretion system protein E [Candidatus Hydrogenosomobacter endosymbioticus]
MENRVQRGREGGVDGFCDALLDRLVGGGALSVDQKNVLMTESQASGKDIEQLLIELSLINEKELSDAMAFVHGNVRIAMSECDVDYNLVRQVPEDIAKSCCAIPVSKTEGDVNGIIIAMSDINDLKSYDAIRKFFPEDYMAVPVACTRSEILEEIHKAYSSSRVSGGDDDLSLLSYNDENSTIEFVQNVLEDAARKKASDIHFEPESIFVRIRYRCDGILYERFCFHQKLWPPVCVRIKVISGMDIAETRRPQDGRFSLDVFGRKIDFRVASHPSIYGESIVIRILDRASSLISMSRLGYSEDSLAKVFECLEKPEGMIILTGPTGSGKTTSLYAMLSLIDAKKTKVMTLEEPVEYCLPNIRQTEIKDGGPLTFVDGIRSILRQDPDVILIGEMRDDATANMAIRAAMTGHKVFTTLHTNNALSAIFRFLDFRVQRSLLSGNINCIIAQRLVRVLCPKCKKKERLPEKKAYHFGLEKAVDAFVSVGCESCRFTGFSGRRAVSEAILMNGEMEEMILGGGSYGEMADMLYRSGFKSMFDDGLELALSGKTSFDEVQRVVGVNSLSLRRRVVFAENADGSV